MKIEEDVQTEDIFIDTESRTRDEVEVISLTIRPLTWCSIAVVFKNMKNKREYEMGIDEFMGRFKKKSTSNMGVGDIYTGCYSGSDIIITETSDENVTYKYVEGAVSGKVEHRDKNRFTQLFKLKKKYSSTKNDEINSERRSINNDIINLINSGYRFESMSATTVDGRDISIYIDEDSEGLSV